MCCEATRGEGARDEACEVGAAGEGKGGVGVQDATWICGVGVGAGAGAWVAVAFGVLRLREEGDGERPPDGEYEGAVRVCGMLTELSRCDCVLVESVGSRSQVVDVGVAVALWSMQGTRIMRRV